MYSTPSFSRHFTSSSAAVWLFGWGVLSSGIGYLCGEWGGNPGGTSDPV
jgi:hypothetical protein